MNYAIKGQIMFNLEAKKIAQGATATVILIGYVGMALYYGLLLL